MAKSSVSLDWCIVRLGDDHNWWVDEVSDPIRWDADGLSIIDPRQVDHVAELVEPLRDYGFDDSLLTAAFISFRIEKEVSPGRVRLLRVKESPFESEDKLFALADILDEENGPYADLLDHITRCRVKLLNDLFEFESKLTVDEMEEEIREEQNASFIEGKAIHTFEELCSLLDYTPTGWDIDEEKTEVDGHDEIGEEDIPEIEDIDEEDDEQLKNDESLKWDEEDEDEEEDEENEDGDDDEDDDEDEADDEDDKPSRRRRR